MPRFTGFSTASRVTETCTSHFARSLLSDQEIRYADIVPFWPQSDPLQSKSQVPRHLLLPCDPSTCRFWLQTTLPFFLAPSKPHLQVKLFCRSSLQDPSSPTRRSYIELCCWRAVPLCDEIWSLFHPRPRIERSQLADLSPQSADASSLWIQLFDSPAAPISTTWFNVITKLTKEASRSNLLPGQSIPTSCVSETKLDWRTEWQSCWGSTPERLSTALSWLVSLSS